MSKILFQSIKKLNINLMKTKKVLKKIGLMSALLLLNITYAQKTISGNILDNEDGSPIPGANVFILGSTTVASFLSTPGSV